MMQYLKDYKDAYDIIFQGIKLIVEIILMVVTVAKGFGALKKYIEDKRNTQLSNYINNFSKKNRVKRLSGVSGLVSNASKIFNELFYICALEKDALIREPLLNGIMKICKRKKKKCKKINSFFVRYSLKEDILINKITIVEERDIMWNYLEMGNTNNRIQLEINHSKYGISFKNDREIEQCLVLSSQLMAGAIKRAIFQSLKGVMFLESSLYEATWVKCSLKNAAVVDCVGRHAKGFGTSIEKVFLWQDDFFDSQFIGLRCKETDIYHANFRESLFAFLSMRGENSITRDSFQNGHESVLETVGFSKSKFYRVRLEEYKVKNGTWNACSFNYCSFHKVDFINNKWHSIVCMNSKFSAVNFWKNELHGTFANCKFEHIKFGGSDLQGSKFVKCTFKEADFAGADLKNVKFEDCIFLENVNLFIKTKNLELQNITGKKALAYIQAHQEEFKSGTE